MEQNGKSNTDPDVPATSNGPTHNKTAHKRSKGKSRVWEKVAWFTRRSRSKDHVVSATAACSESDLSGLPLDNMDFDIFPSGSCYGAAGLQQGQPSWIGSSSSTDSWETFHEFQDGYRVKRSRLYPNSEIIEQHCLKPSVARALFHQMEAASCRGGKGHKYAWQTKKKKKSHSIPWYNKYTEDPTEDGLERAVSMPTGIMSASQCHCSACCTCTPTQRLMGMCPAHARLSSSTTSLDTGLTLSAASCGHDVTTVCSNQDRTSENVAPNVTFSPNTSFDDHDVMQRIAESSHMTSTQDHDVTVDDDDCLSHLANSVAMTATDGLHQFKSNSLPMYFSKRCKLCNKPQTNKAHLPRYPHVPNVAQFCTCGVQMNAPSNSRAHPPNRNAPQTSYNPVKPPPEVSSDEPSKSSYQTDKVDALEFKHRRQMMKEWFSEFNDEQKNLLLKDLLEEECDLPQIHLLSIHMAPRLHEGCPPNCSDLLTWLPTGIANHILSFLDPVSLCRASMVCRVWHQLANDVSQWRRFCSQPKWQLSRAGEQKQLIQHMLPNGNIHWKAVFSERFRLRNNWLAGRCNVRTFEGHTQGVSCVQFDDTRIVSGSSDKTIKVWNIRTNTPWSVQTLVGHSGTVRCLHLEGNRLVSGSTDKTIKVWDLSTQHTWSSIACKVTMVGHTDTVRCLQVDDEKVVSGSYDKTLKVWDIRSGRCRMTLRGHDAAVLCVQFDDSKIVSGSCDKTIKLWTFEGACVMTLPGHHDAVTCLQFDDTRIVSGSLDCNLKFWDVHTGACSNTIDWKASEGHTGVVRCLQADSWRVVSASDDRTLKVWSLETGQRLVTLRNHTDGVTCLQFNDSIIVSGSYDKTVKLWDFTSC